MDTDENSPNYLLVFCHHGNLEGECDDCEEEYWPDPKGMD